MEEWGWSLPKWFRSEEIYTNKHFFTAIELGTFPTLDLVELSFNKFRKGDIFFFSCSENKSPKDMHMAVFSGFDVEGQPEFIHAVAFKKDGDGENRDAVVIWNLAKFSRSRFYPYFHGVRRVANNVKMSEADENWYYQNYQDL